MPILNYTTRVPAERTVAEIQAMLARHGALSVRVDYRDKLAAAIEFETLTQTLGHQAYRWEANPKGVLEAMKRDKKVARSACTEAQAVRVAWRIEKDWLEAQLAKIESCATPIEKIMLPYMVAPDGRSFYEHLVEQHLKALPEASPSAEASASRETK